MEFVFTAYILERLKKKLMKANKIGSKACLILGEEELKDDKVIWKNMISGSQEKFDIKKINEFLKKKQQIKVSIKKVFSSKPAQITNAAIKLTTQIFGEDKQIDVAAIGDKDLVFSIASNFKKYGYDNCKVF